MNYHHHLFQLICFTLIVIASAIVNVTQAQSTKTLLGQITLDIGPAVKELSVEISIRNHSFVVLPPPFGIVRPIQSSVTTRVIIGQGESSALYSLTGIIDNPVDYTIQIKCPGCDDIIPTQYYSPDGNRFGLSNSAYLDPNGFPAQLDLDALTRASISGEIKLLNPASRDLDFLIVVASSQYPDFILATDSTLTIAQGEQTVNYQIFGLQRSQGPYLVSLQCKSCLGKAHRRRPYEMSLAAQSNHSNIDFTQIDEGSAIITPFIYLLLLEND